ncbi:MAG: hypothetical protein K0S74_1228 [Chlamydiales bacterium]|jgi:drug/metabolite transporter (DMT)-like permease|nr:hypothetical protein [Chlamydiales bacterium]
MLLPIVNTALDGFSFTVNKFLLEYTSPIVILTLRMLIAGLLLFIYQFFKDRKELVELKRHIPSIIIIAVAFSLANGLRLWSINYLTSTRTALLSNLGPFISYLLGILLVREKVHYKKILGLIVGFAGCLPVILSDNIGTEESLNPAFWLSGPEIAAIASVVCFSLAWMNVQNLTKKGFGATSANAWVSLTTGIVSLIFALFTGELSLNFKSSIFTDSFNLWLGISVAIQIFTGTLCTWLLKTHSVTLITFVSLLTPLFTAITEWAWFGTSIGWDFYVSGTLVALGLSIFLSADKQTNAPLST